MTERIHVRKKGFTLVEVIVVLVVLAILAAILIPSLVKWIDEANIKRCMSEQGQVIRDYHACAANTGYGKLEPVVPTTLLNEAVQDVTNKTRTASGGGYTCSGGGSCTVSFSADGTTISDIVCSRHGSFMTGKLGSEQTFLKVVESISGNATATVNNVATLPYVKSRLDSNGKFTTDVTINSEAVRTKETTTAQSLNKLLKAAGVEADNVSYSVALKKGTTLASPQSGQYVIYWSDAKITSTDIGNTVTVTKYDVATKAMVTGTMEVKDNLDGTNHYPILDTTTFQETP